MAKRKLTKVQKIIKDKIPDLFKWHPKCQNQVEELVKELIDNQ